MNPATIDLDWCSFYVRIHDLPLIRQTPEIAMLVGNRLGIFEELDPEGAWGANMRVRVRLNITKPLKRVLKIRGSDGEEIVVSFSYERLPNFCYLCGKMGHILRECELRYDLGIEIDEDN